MFDDIGHNLTIKDLDAWYDIPAIRVSELGGKSIMAQYDSSIAQALSTIYPDHEWNMSRFGKSRTLISPSERRTEMLRIGEALGVSSKKLSEWYNITCNDVVKEDGRSILMRYNGSLSAALQDVFPDYPWVMWHFKQVPKNFWDDISNQRNKMNTIGEILGVKHLDNWHTVSTQQILDHNAGGILKRYNFSVNQMISAIYSEYAFHFPQQPLRRPKGHWQDPKRQLDFLRRLQKSMRITTPESWYNVTSFQIAAHGGQGLLQYFPHVLSAIEPQFRFQWENFSVTKRLRTQKWLLKCVKHLFPDHTVVEEYFIGTRATGSIISLDIFIPDYFIGIEYQGEQHFQDNVHKDGNCVLAQRWRDDDKEQLCNDLGITWVPIPYWWKGDVDTISATIVKACPETMLKVPRGAIPLSPDAYSSSQPSLMAPSESPSGTLKQVRAHL